MVTLNSMARLGRLCWALLSGCCFASCQAFSGVGDLKIVEDESGDDDAMNAEPDADDMAGGSGADDEGEAEAGAPDDDSRADDLDDRAGDSDDDDAVDDDGDVGTDAGDAVDDQVADDAMGEFDAGPRDQCEPNPGASCELAADCGCAAGETCHFDAELDAVACRPLGVASSGEPCDESDDCGAGATCLAGNCQLPCAETSDCGEAETCASGFVSDSGQRLEQRYCVIACSPFESDSGCSAGDRCHILSDEVAGCLASGDAGLNDSCERSSDCGPGLECAELGAGDATCMARCSVERGCSGSCIPLDPEQNYDGDTSGVCVCDYADGFECSPTEQCGCAAGLACSLVLPDYLTECHEPGPGDTREACSDYTDCAAGQLCVLGVCAPYCDVDDDCPDEGTCIVNNNFQPPVGLCTTPCDAVAPNAPEDGTPPCPDSMTCIPFFEGQSSEFTCATERSAATQGQSCDSELDLFQCAPGFACAADATGDALECRRWCEVGQSCDGGGVCEAVTTFRGRELGLCTTPVCGNGVVEGGEVCDDGNLDEEDGCTTACAPCGTLNGQSECNLAPSCGCAAGQACQVIDAMTGTASCVPAGSGQLDERCEELSDCAIGLSCVGMGPTLQLCTSQCSASNDSACGPTEACSQLYSGTEPSPDNFVCLDVCDPVRVGFEDDGVQACSAGTQCVPGVTYASCVEDTGNAAPLDECTNTGDCEPGALCVLGICRRVCSSQADCPQSRDVCNLGLDLLAKPDEPVGVCAVPCEPVGVDSGCDEGQYCLASSAPPICIEALDSGVVGDACVYHADCAEGLACAGGCVQWCRTNSDCAVATPSCVLVTGYVDASGVALGVCN